MKTSHVALGVLGGVVVGTVLGVLFAPEKGTTTRKKIASKGTDLKNSLEDLTNKAYGKINKLSSKANQLVDEALDEGEQSLNNIRDINKSIL